MEPERWRRLEELLHAALERPDAERQAFLDEACGGDAELLQEVEDLVRADERAGSFLGRPLLEGGGAGERRIGPYRLERKLGEGGTGAVYLAERDDGQYRQRVAVKLIRFGMESEEHLRRFRVERQILAHLDHPHIARLYEGGATEEGLPYFAMELVEGEPIDLYCDRRRLTLRQRLELFCLACSAVHFAHQSLVVHRDLKPSNVLVTADGNPKLLDFGIAKLLDPEMAPPGSEATRTWNRPMTPHYASPEQVRGEAVTVATDVYSLGVVLYELLVGRRPHDVTGLTAPEIERVLTEQRPKRPSAVAGPVPEGAADDGSPPVARVARDRGGLRPEGLRRRLEGDLDNIVLKALHPDPAQRYGSAEHLSDDLRRHLSGRPVQAHPDSFTYRAGKLLQRHRAAAASALLVVLLVVTSVVLLALQSARITRERNQAELERDKAREVTTLLEDVFKVSDPWTVTGRAPSARELLDRTVEELEGADPPSDVQAALMSSMGRIYRHHGDLETAERLMTRAHEALVHQLGPGHPEVASSLSDLGMMYYDMGRYARAEEDLGRALEIRVERFGEPSVEVVQSLCELAIVLAEAGDYEEAEGLYRRALAGLGELPDAPAWLRGQVHLNLGTLLHQQGRYGEAETVTHQALATLREALGPEHPGAIGTLNTLAAIRLARGDLEGAAAGFREVARLYRRVLGGDHPKVAVAIGNLAVVTAEMGRYEEAVALNREALDLRRRTLGHDHPFVASSLSNLARALRKSGDADAAEPLQRQALAIRRQSLGEDHPHVAGDLSKLAWILLDRGDHEGAEELFREALARRRALLGEDHPELADTLVGLGRLLTATARAEEAEALLREAVAVRRRELGADHWKTAAAESDLGACLTTLGRYAEAEPLLVRSHRRMDARRPRGDGDALLARRRLSELYDAWDRPAQAAAYR